jgi:hypothetical protein
VKAFPGKTLITNGRYPNVSVIHGGMDLRDYFAGQVVSYSYHTNRKPCEIADAAYNIADAMMKRRKQGIENV